MKKGLIILAVALMLVCVVSCAASKDNGTLVIDLSGEMSTQTELEIASYTGVFLKFENGRVLDAAEGCLDITKAYKSKKQIAKVSLPSGVYEASVLFSVTPTDSAKGQYHVYLTDTTDTDLVIKAGKTTNATAVYEEN